MEDFMAYLENKSQVQFQELSLNSKDNNFYTLKSMSSQEGHVLGWVLGDKFQRC